MIITIDTNTEKIEIKKDEKIKTVPVLNHPPKYNNISIKRIYYKKTDPEYHRKKTFPITTKKASTFLISGKTVKQAPLLDLY